MNGENNRVLADRAAASPPQLRKALFEAQLWLLAMFVAMSLVAAAARSVIDGGESPAVSAVMAIAGIALLPVAWRNVVLLFEGSDSTPPAEAACASAKPATGNLRLALQR